MNQCRITGAVGRRLMYKDLTAKTEKGGSDTF